MRTRRSAQTRSPRPTRRAPARLQARRLEPAARRRRRAPRASRDALGGPALIEAATQIVEYARAALDGDHEKKSKEAGGAAAEDLLVAQRTRASRAHGRVRSALGSEGRESDRARSTRRRGVRPRAGRARGRARTRRRRPAAARAPRQWGRVRRDGAPVALPSRGERRRGAAERRAHRSRRSVGRSGASVARGRRGVRVVLPQAHGRQLGADESAPRSTLRERAPTALIERFQHAKTFETGQASSFKARSPTDCTSSRPAR